MLNNSGGYRFILRNAYLLILVCGLSCDNPSCEPTASTTLTPATHTGAETFSFLDNGVVWSACNGFGDPPQRFTLVSSGLTLAAVKGCGGPWQFFGLTIDKFKGMGRYILSLGSDTLTAQDGSATFTNGYEGSGFVDITFFDSIKHIVSGTFEFSGIAYDSTVHKIADGRFDLTYPYIR